MLKELYHYNKKKAIKEKILKKKERRIYERGNIKKVDHTLLKQISTMEDIKKLCDDAIKFNTASVCIPPCYVKEAKEYVGDKMKICTVIGFPNGYNLTSVKMFETEEAIKDGADVQ